MKPSKSAALTVRELRERIAQIRADIEDFNKIREAALESLQLTAAVNAKTRVVALHGELDRMSRALRVAKEADPYRRLLMLRDGATADGSHVAAANFERLALEVLARMTAEEERRRVEQMEGASWDELWALIQPALLTMDRAQALQVVAEVLRRDDVDPEEVRDLIEERG